MKYALWNATVSALQFWMKDLEPNTLSAAIERVYMAFSCSKLSQQLHTSPNEILFSCFMTTLNDAFEHELAQEDEGYESGSESLYIPTPLCKAPHMYYVSTCDNLSFRPATPRSCPSPGSLTTLHCHLTFEEDEESSINRNTTHDRMEHHLPDKNTMAHHLPHQYGRRG